MSEHQFVVWITGASSGLGASLAEEFCKRGAFVFATSRRMEKLQQLKEKIDNSNINSGYKLEVIKCDVSDKFDVQNCFEKISELGKIDCLINNAGVTSFNKAKKDSLEDIDKIINTNLLGAIYTIKSVIPAMINQNSGTIINILSVVTEKIFSNSSIYSASKLGLKGYTRVLREEVRNNNIRVINISPGATETEIWSEEIVNKYSERMMKPIDLASLIADIFYKQNSIVIEDIVIRPQGGDL